MRFETIHLFDKKSLNAFLPKHSRCRLSFQFAKIDTCLIGYLLTAAQAIANAQTSITEKRRG
jgi:hypothetical protein